MAEQLIFDLPVRNAMGRNDFFVAPSNANAVALIDGWRDWPGGKLALTGPPGSGKTHLAHVWAADVRARIVSAMALGHDAVTEIAAAGHVVVEDVHRLAPDREAALFHLHNLVTADHGRLLLTGVGAPATWPVMLPDLRSRLEGTTTVRLDPPDDALLTAVLVKLFSDRQIDVPPATVSYLIPRIPRSFEAVRDVVNRLDAAALIAGGPITRNLAARVLDFSGDDGA